MVTSEFSCDTQFEKNTSTNHTAIMGLPSDRPAATSIVGADVPVNPSVSDFSSKTEQQVCEDSCYGAHKEPLSESNDDAMDGLSLMSHEVRGDGTIVAMKGQHSNIFQAECKIQDKVCKLIIDGGSFTNTISSYLVYALSLSTWRLPKPRYMQWMNQGGTLKIMHRARVKFLVGNYTDTVDCDVVPMNACHLLLGRPWQFDLDATHKGRSNCY